MANKRRIVHMLRAPVGGLFRHACDLAAEQARRGHDVGLLYDATTCDRLTSERLVQLAGKLGLGLHKIVISRQPSLRDITSFMAARRVARAAKADILHGHGAKGGALARLVATSLGRGGQGPSSFYTPHGGSLLLDKASAKNRLLHAIEGRLERHATGLIFESQYVEQLYRTKVSTPRVPVRVVCNGVLEGDFAPRNIAPDAADFLFIGELRAVKGVDILLRALADLNRAGPSTAGGTKPATAVIAGGGPDSDALKKLAAELGIANRVTFTGAIPAAYAFALGRALVVPSRAESLPYVVLEAAAADVPLIATNVGGIPEIAGDLSTRLLPAGDVEALTVRMRQFLNNPVPFRDEASRLRERVATLFTVAHMTDEILDFYEAAARTQPALAQSALGAVPSHSAPRADHVGTKPA